MDGLLMFLAFVGVLIAAVLVSGYLKKKNRQHIEVDPNAPVEDDLNPGRFLPKVSNETKKIK